MAVGEEQSDRSLSSTHTLRLMPLRTHPWTSQRVGAACAGDNKQRPNTKYKIRISFLSCRGQKRKHVRCHPFGHWRCGGRWYIFFQPQGGRSSRGRPRFCREPERHVGHPDHRPSSGVAHSFHRGPERVLGLPFREPLGGDHRGRGCDRAHPRPRDRGSERREHGRLRHLLREQWILCVGADGRADEPRRQHRLRHRRRGCVPFVRPRPAGDGRARASRHRRQHRRRLLCRHHFFTTA